MNRGGTQARRMRPHVRVRCMHGWLGGRSQLGRSQKGGEGGARRHQAKVAGRKALDGPRMSFCQAQVQE